MAYNLIAYTMLCDTLVGLKCLSQNEKKEVKKITVSRSLISTKSDQQNKQDNRYIMQCSEKSHVRLMNGEFTQS